MSDFLDEEYDIDYFIIKTSDIEENTDSQYPVGVGNITTDDTGETITTYIYDTIIQNGVNIEKNITDPVLLPPPSLDFINCNIYNGLLEDGRPSIHSFEVQWIPEEGIEYYKVFWLINSQSSVWIKSVNYDVPLNSIGEQLFTGESENLIDINRFDYTFIPDDRVINDVSIFVFSYKTARCDFPIRLISGILIDDNGIDNKNVYLKKSTYVKDLNDTVSYLIETDLKTTTVDELYIDNKSMLNY